MVPGAADGLAASSDYECKYGCDSSDNDSCGITGKSLFVQKYTSVLYNTGRIFPGGLSGGQSLRTSDGKSSSWRHTEPAVWSRKRLRSSNGTVSSWDFGCRDLPGVRTDFEEVPV